MISLRAQLRVIGFLLFFGSTAQGIFPLPPPPGLLALLAHKHTMMRAGNTGASIRRTMTNPVDDQKRAALQRSLNELGQSMEKLRSRLDQEQVGQSYQNDMSQMLSKNLLEEAGNEPYVPAPISVASTTPREFLAEGPLAGDGDSGDAEYFYQEEEEDTLPQGMEEAPDVVVVALTPQGIVAPKDINNSQVSHPTYIPRTPPTQQADLKALGDILLTGNPAPSVGPRSERTERTISVAAPATEVTEETKTSGIRTANAGVGRGLRGTRLRAMGGITLSDPLRVVEGRLPDEDQPTAIAEGDQKKAPISRTESIASTFPLWIWSSNVLLAILPLLALSLLTLIAYFRLRRRYFTQLVLATSTRYREGKATL